MKLRVSALVHTLIHRALRCHEVLHFLAHMATGRTKANSVLRYSQRHAALENRMKFEIETAFTQSKVTCKTNVHSQLDLDCLAQSSDSRIIETTFYTPKAHSVI